MGTIRVSPDTRSRLANLKEHPRESFDRVINRLIDFYEDDDPLTKEDIDAIKEALKDVKDGRTYTSEQLKKELGLT
jgi:predicted transcriptional regulator